jgi:hypothetical protein
MERHTISIQEYQNYVCTQNHPVPNAAIWDTLVVEKEGHWTDEFDKFHIFPSTPTIFLKPQRFQNVTISEIP